MSPTKQSADTLDMHAADVATFRADIAYLSKQFDAHDKHDIAHQASVDTRLRTIERLMYIGIGGLLSLTGIASFFGWNILKMLGK